MSRELYFCKRCEEFFDTPKYYYERHGLDTPPYQRVYVCPRCEGDDFIGFDNMVEKIEIVEKLLLCVMFINRYIDKVQEALNIEVKNCDLSNGVEIITELIGELFDFIDVDMQRKLLKLNDEQKLHRILIYLRGGL